MPRRWTMILAACAVILSGAAAAEDAVDDKDAVAAEALAEADARELFLRCCWALGRAGYQYCVQYGVCKSDPEATCEGVGAADGMKTSCSTPPPDLPGEGG